MKKVLVSGISGHLGFTLAKLLLEKGYNVRGCMRNSARIESMPHLQNLNIEIVEADITDFDKMKSALRGLDGYFHVAAVYNLVSKNPKKEIIETNVQGTEVALKAAAAVQIEKVIYTSSTAAVGTVAKGERAKDEISWNLGSKEPYALSKALSEKRAWEISKELHLPLISVLPGTMIGPGFITPTPSVEFFITALAGKMPIAPPLTFNYVDVRDVADAHVRVFESPEAQGRYLATDKTWTAAEGLMLLKELRPELRFYGKTIPLSLAKWLPHAEALQNRFFGTPLSVTPEAVQEYFGREQSYKSDRLRKELGWKTRPVQDSLLDTLQWLQRIET